MMAAKGFVHSVQTLGAVDGPGLRFVAFLQGCPLRCLMCHNPDTWTRTGGTPMEAQTLVDMANRYRPYFGEAGGITLSGGEPLAQVEFSLEVVKRAKAQGLHTCLDTSGYRLDAQTRLVYRRCDLVLLDIKHAFPKAYSALTGKTMEGLLRTIDYLTELQKPVWIRQVLIPGWTDSPAQITALAHLLQGLRIEKAELLPYHRMGVSKWHALGRDYPLEQTPLPTQEALQELSALLNKQLKLKSEG